MVIKIVYQKYPVVSMRLGRAPPVWKRSHVQKLNDSRLTIRGDEDQDLVASDDVWTRPVILSPAPC